MDFLLYEAEDFASDESYLKYYFRLNDSDVAFWQGWISNHPEKLDCVINADQLINLLALQLDENELLHEHQRLLSSIKEKSDEVVADSHEANRLNPFENVFPLTHTPLALPPKPGKRKIFRVIKVVLASAMILVITVSGWYFAVTKKILLTQDAIQTAQSQDLLNTKNSGNEPSMFQLEDGSVITLQPGSVLKYPHHFSSVKREVYLEGAAFFEVRKNKNRPFYVYCQSLVAHALGTSFNVKSDNDQGKVEVTVRTGKVEVYKNYFEENKESKVKNNGLILTPNQKAIYNVEINQFESSLVDIPLPITYTSEESKTDSLPKEPIYLKAAPMSEILLNLERTYGIEIEIENDNISNCHFSGDLLELNLYVKLDIICQSLNATYEIKGTKILIKGKGCN